MADDTAPGPPPREGSVFRGIVGISCILGSMAGFFLLYFVEVPAGNKEPLLLALGIIFGWGSAVVQSEYGASTTGRRVADQAIKNMETK